MVTLREDISIEANQALGRMIDWIEAGEPNLTDRQLAILMLAAWTVGPHKLKHVAELLRAPKAAITRAVSTLQDHGFARRAYNPDDRRQCYIEATDEGIAFLQRYIEQ